MLSKRYKSELYELLVLHSSSPVIDNIKKIMVFKLAIATVALAAFAGAANYKRVTCPDGVNTATHEAVSAQSFDTGATIY